MKKTLLITLLSLAPLSAYADDASPFDMFLSVDAGYSHYSPSNSNIPTSNTNDSSYKTRATFAYTDPSQFGVQVDGVYSKNNIDTFDSSTADLAGHIFYRTEKYLVGGFAQYRNPKLSVSNNASSYLSDVFAPDQVFWGAEAQGYFDKFTVYGQLAYQDFINQQKDFKNFQLFNHGFVATVKGTYFIEDNWKVDVSYAYNKVKVNPDGIPPVTSIDQNTFGLSTEYRFNNQPFSVYASYEHSKLDLSLYGNTDVDRAMFGVKWSFGKETLISRDRSGASLDPISQDPTFSTGSGAILNRCFKNNGCGAG